MIKRMKRSRNDVQKETMHRRGAELAGIESRGLVLNCIFVELRDIPSGRWPSRAASKCGGGVHSLAKKANGHARSTYLCHLASCRRYTSYIFINWRLEQHASTRPPSTTDVAVPTRFNWFASSFVELDFVGRLNVS